MVSVAPLAMNTITIARMTRVFSAPSPAGHR
jgi:hypothetical protein